MKQSNVKLQKKRKNTWVELNKELSIFSLIEMLLETTFI